MLIRRKIVIWLCLMITVIAVYATRRRWWRLHNRHVHAPYRVVQAHVGSQLGLFCCVIGNIIGFTKGTNTHVYMYIGALSKYTWTKTTISTPPGHGYDRCWSASKQVHHRLPTSAIKQMNDAAVRVETVCAGSCYEHVWYRCQNTSNSQTAASPPPTKRTSFMALLHQRLEN